jgi:hypothetical protein
VAPQPFRGVGAAAVGSGKQELNQIELNKIN